MPAPSHHCGSQVAPGLGRLGAERGAQPPLQIRLCPSLPAVLDSDCRWSPRPHLPRGAGYRRCQAGLLSPRYSLGLSGSHTVPLPREGRRSKVPRSLPPGSALPLLHLGWPGPPPVQTPRGLPAASTKCGVRRALAQYGRSAGLRWPLLCGLGRPVTCEQHSPAGGGCAGPLSASRGQRLGCAPALGVWGAERVEKASNSGPPGVCFLGPQVGPGAA